MEKKNDGGPAFPRQHLTYDEGGYCATDGMTLRDYFAGQALIGMVGQTKGLSYDGNIAGDTGAIDRCVTRSWLIADAMLKEREK